MSNLTKTTYRGVRRVAGGSNALAMRKANLAFWGGCVQSGLNLVQTITNARTEARRLNNARYDRTCQYRENIAQIKANSRKTRARLKNRREAIVALLQVAINSNDPEMIRAMGEALRSLDEEV